MEKMYLVPTEEYQSLKGQGADKKMASSSKEPSDVSVTKYQDAYIRQEDQKQIQDKQSYDSFLQKVKPLFSSFNNDLSEILQGFSDSDQVPARFIIDFLLRLPRVSVNKNVLYIDGQAIHDSFSNVINDILRNNVKGVESLINALRKRSTLRAARSRPVRTPVVRSLDADLQNATTQSVRPKKRRSNVDASFLETIEPLLAESFGEKVLKPSPIKTRSQTARQRSSATSSRGTSRHQRNNTASPRLTLKKLAKYGQARATWSPY